MRSLDTILSIGVLAFGLVCGALIVTMNKGGGSGGHDHGHGGDSDHGEGHEKGVAGINLDDSQIDTAAILLKAAEGAVIESDLRIRGQISINHDKQTEVAPRLGGTVLRVLKSLGDPVRKGEVVAYVESNTTRAALEVRSGLDGVVTEVKVGSGAYASEKEPILVVADLTNVWAEFLVPIRDAGGIQIGQRVKVREVMRGSKTEGRISFVSPMVDSDTQAMLVRVDLTNSDGTWRPGAFIDGEVTAAPKQATIAVRKSALHQLDGDSVVFVREGDVFTPRRVQIGAASRDTVEILSGVRAGETYAADNSFIIKAELLKSTAEHSH